MDDAVERAALDESVTTPGLDPATRVRVFNAWAEQHPEGGEYGAFQAGYRAARAAARAGEADGPDWSDWHSHGYADGYLAAQCGGEAVDREALAERVHRLYDGVTASQAVAAEKAVRGALDRHYPRLLDGKSHATGHQCETTDDCVADITASALAARGAAPTRYPHTTPAAQAAEDETDAAIVRAKVRADAASIAASVYPEDYHGHLRECFAHAYERGALDALGVGVQP